MKLAITASALLLLFGCTRSETYVSREGTLYSSASTFGIARQGNGARWAQTYYDDSGNTITLTREILGDQDRNGATHWWEVVLDYVFRIFPLFLTYRGTGT